MESWLEKARKESALSLEDCASALKCSRATVESRIKRPGTLSINELRVLNDLFRGKSIDTVRIALKEAMPNFFAK